MQYSSPIYVISHLFGHTLEIQLKHYFLWKKSLDISYFWGCNAHTASPLFRESSILKLHDKIAQENWFFITKYFIKFSPTLFKNWFTLSFDFHAYSTCWSNLNCLIVPPHNTKLYGRNSVYVSAIYTWNSLQKLNEINIFYQLSPSNLKIILKKFFKQLQLILTQLNIIHATSETVQL